MKISLDWLGDYVKWKEQNAQKIADAITVSVAEVDEVEKQGNVLDKCTVGKILSITKHPNADSLYLCQVKTNAGTKKVVCGGTNLREGMKIAFAPVGATVRWHGGDFVTLEKVKIRGEESEGMICAPAELELGTMFPTKEERELVDLGDGDEGVGKPLKEYLGLGDTILHIDNHAITNRADLFCHIGFAREAVALGLASWKKKPEFKAPKFGKSPVPFKMNVESKKLMPCYFSCVIEIDGLGETPVWMKKRLEATGWRSLNLPIDITNYVAMEVGVPLHSFDLDDIKGDVSMRAAKKGETIVTLDNVKRNLPEGALILSDKEGVFDLLGIMGGLRSSTKASTKRIYLHSAVLHPVSIRRAMVATGHRTDAGTVYEKGVSPYTAEQGFYRAVELFLDLVPGAKVVSKLSSHAEKSAPKKIAISPQRIIQKIGKDISLKEMEAALTDLGCSVKKQKAAWTITVPAWRNDVKEEEDIFEEVARIYGYNDIPAVMPRADITPPERDTRTNSIRDVLASHGYIEVVPLSIMGASMIQRAGLDPQKAVEVANPLGEEYSLMHTSTLPGLLDHAERAFLQADKKLQTFTIANVFEKGKEETELGMLLVSKEQTTLKNDPVLTVKSQLSAALACIGTTVSVSELKAVPAFGHPGRSMELSAQGKVIGMLTELRPAISERFGFPHRTAVAFVSLTKLLSLQPERKVAKALPKFPAISYDTTFTMTQQQSAGALMERIKKSSQLLESTEVIDLYSGSSLPKDAYNMTIRCTYRAADRTLTEEEAKKEYNKALAVLPK